MKARTLMTMVCVAISRIALQAQEVVREWNFRSLSEASVANLDADPTLWGWNTKGRYVNNVPNDGDLLRANGQVIAEYDGIYIGAGIEAGSLLLWKSESSNNGLQMQRSRAVTMKGRHKDETVLVKIKSSSKNSAGIESLSNMTGLVGADSYTTSSYKTYELTVKADGDISFTPTAGVIIQSIQILSAAQGEMCAKPEILVEEGCITMNCATEEAQIYYTLVDHGNAWDYGQPYVEPVTPGRTCRIRAYAEKEGMRRSEVAETRLEVPVVLPYTDRPFVLDPEPLDRGAIATWTSSGMLVNWRWLIDDPADVAFNVYRNGSKITGQPLTTKTNILDAGGNASTLYEVEVISGGEVVEKVTARNLPKGYWDIPLNRPEGGETPSGAYEYIPGDCMVADLDGDHEYEVVMKWDPCNAGDHTNSETSGAGQKDNSQVSYTGPVLIDAYRMDGTQLWRINLGRNIRAGAHYTQLMVYDLDGDGRAEVACKTAPGTVDGKGQHVIMEGDDPEADYRSSSSSSLGTITKGPEYLTVFCGETGAELATTAYLPPRDIISSWGDSYGNRSERYLACVAYLDGVHPSLVMCRGYYTAAFLWAVDFDGNQLETRWLYSETRGGMGAFGEGAHTVQVADVDGDLRDEILYGSCAIDDDGTLLYRTGLGHGDAMHVGDLDPDHPGLEVMMVHEETTAAYGIEMHDALTGEHLSGVFAGSDVGRGMCADVDPTHRGCEYWGFGNNVYDCKGNLLGTKRPSINFRTYWDGDLQEELTEKGVITKWTNATSSAKTLVDMPSKYKIGSDLIKWTPCLQADIFGDWREEQIYYDAATCSHLWIFSTSYISQYRVPCLMQDHHYRMATVWQTSAYNQPPHLSYYLPDFIEQGANAIESLSAESQLTELNFDLWGRRILHPGQAQGIILKARR